MTKENERIFEVHEGEDYIVILDNQEHDSTENPVATVCDRLTAEMLVTVFNTCSGFTLAEIKKLYKSRE